MDNINDIISSLSAEDIEMLKGVAGSILGEQPNVNSEPAQKNNNALAGLGDLNLNNDDFKMLMRAKGIIDKMNSTQSKNADLINALKPHLSKDSQKKADQAIRILKLFDILPYLKDLF
ncbi:MAG: hypothetical protein ACI4IG_01210 [Eubacterium sp.]